MVFEIVHTVVIQKKKKKKNTAYLFRLVKKNFTILSFLTPVVHGILLHENPINPIPYCPVYM